MEEKMKHINQKLITIFTLIALLFTLTACKKAVTYTFEANGGTTIEKMQSSNGVATSPTTTKNGYQLVGWYEHADLTGDAISFPYKVKNNVTLYAKWQVVDYKIQYITLDGKLSANAPMTYNVENYPVLPTATKEGYTLQGWIFENEVITELPTTLCKDITLVANWVKEDTAFTVQFVTYGGIAIAPMHTTCIQTAPQTSLAGDEFLGWYLEPTFDTMVTFPYTVTRDVTLYAKWKNADVVEEYTITFDTNGGTTLPSFVGTTLETAPVPEKEHAIFVNWYTDAALTKQAKFPLTPVDDMTLYAKWAPKQDISDAEMRELASYLQKAYTNYHRVFQQKVSNENGLVFQGVNNYYIDANKIYFVYPGMDADGNYLKDEQGNYIYFREYVFLDESENTYHYYYESSEGKYPYNGKLYTCYVTANPYTDGPDGEGILDALFLEELLLLDASDFYPYEGKWYVKDEAVNEIAKKLLGDQDSISQSGNQYSAVTEAFKQLALTFDENGVLTHVDALSEMLYAEGSTVSGVLQYKYNLEYHFIIDEIDNVSIPNESELFQYNDTPSGLYPVLDENNSYRNQFVLDETVYTVSDLMQALANLKQYQAFYTLAANFNTQNFLYQEELIHVRDQFGKVDVIGSSNAGYYYYDIQTGVTYYILGNNVFADQYSYKNNYYYNQYLLEDAWAVNVKVPTSNLSLLDTSHFSYSQEGHYFEFTGTKKEMLALGRFIFGNLDYDLPPYYEYENYNYIRLYLNNGRLAKVVAASAVDVYDQDLYTPQYTEYYIKEVVLLTTEPEAFVFPINTDTLVMPGEVKEDGSLDRLKDALNKMGDNYTYADVFKFVDTDETYGIDDDIYRYDGAKAMITSSYYYYKNGVPFVYSPSIAMEYEADNTWIKWGTPLLRLLDVDWFYEGKDGNYYCKPEYLEACSEVLSRYSGSKAYLQNQSSTYRMAIHLDFIQLNMASGRIMSIYYTGVMTTTGLQGSYDQIFSGIGSFTNVGSTRVTMPTAVQEYDTTLPEQVRLYLDAPSDFSVTGEAVLSIAQPTNVLGYYAYVYLNGVEVENSPFQVINGTEFKGLLADGTYTLKLVAYGNSKYYMDSLPSQEIEFVVSKYTQLDTPSHPKVNSSTMLLTFDGVTGATEYVVELLLAGKRISLTTVSETSFDLSGLTAGTYQIQIYAVGDNVTYRDSEKLSVQYTVTADGELSNLEKIYEAMGGSFKVRNASTLYCDFDGVSRAFEYSFDYIYDALSKRGKLEIRLRDKASNYNYQNPYMFITVYYYIENGIDMARYVIVRSDGTTTTKTESNVLRPYALYQQVSKDAFVEDGKYYNLVETASEAYYANMSLLEEVFYAFDVKIKYESIQFGYMNWNNPNEDMKLYIVQTFEDGSMAKQGVSIIIIEDGMLANDKGF